MIQGILLFTLVAVLIPDDANAVCCGDRGLFESCATQNGHTCNIFCCNCDGGRPGTSVCERSSTITISSDVLGKTGGGVSPRDIMAGCSINNINQFLSNTSKKFQEQTQMEILS